MYYLELIHRFWIYNQNIHMGSTAVAMYLYLLKTAGEHDRYDFRISDVKISNELKLTRKTVKLTKEKLMKWGLIEFKTENGLPCSYKITVNYVMRLSTIENVVGSSGINKTDKNCFDTKTVHSIDSSSELTSIEDDLNEAEKVSGKNIFTDNDNIPSFKELLNYAKTLVHYRPAFDDLIFEKYNTWKDNGWRNSSGHPIINWKSLIKNSSSLFENNSNKNIFYTYKIPDIKRPK